MQEVALLKDWNQPLWEDPNYRYSESHTDRPAAGRAWGLHREGHGVLASTPFFHLLGYFCFPNFRQEMAFNNQKGKHKETTPLNRFVGGREGARLGAGS